MASLSNINGLFDVHSTGAILFSTSHGTSGQILRSNGDAAPTWIDFSSTGFGGDYLLLTGGVLTGNLTINGTNNLTVGGTVGVTGLLTGTTGSFSGLVSGITPTAAANFATKAYVDAITPGVGVFLPLAGGALTGATSITVGTNTTTFSTTANQLIIKNSYHASASGLALRSSNDTHCMQLYGEAAAYGFLASEWGAWNIRKVVSGGLYLNNNTTYFVQPEGTSNMNAATFAGLVSGITPTATANFTTKAYVDAAVAAVPQGDITGLTAGTGITIAAATGPVPTITNSAPNIVQTSVTGNAGTATALQTARTINAVSFNGTANIMVPSIYDGNYRRVTNPGGAEYVTTTSSVTGTIEIIMPITSWTGMFSFTVEVYEYITNRSFTLKVGGHISGTSWYNEFAYLVGNPGTNLAYTIRFGRNAAGKAVVYVGELAETWSYPQAWVTDICWGYSGGGLTLTTGWDINFRTAAFEGVTKTQTAVQVGYQQTGNIANSVVLRDGSGGFSAGAISGTTFNGLAINTTGTNNVANQIVRTDVNGYANFGWINSISGATTSTITRITASSDAYLRYVTPATFRSQITDPYYAPTGTVSGVTSVATGSGLTGGTITTTGTLSLDRPNSQLGAVLATYGTTAGSSGRVRCTAPFNTNTGKMFSIEITLYGSYTQHNYVVSAYMYSTTNQWYSPKAIYTTTGTATPDITVGRDANGKAYISIANANYTGVLVHNMTRGYQTSLADTYDPWTISITGGTENSVGVSTSQVWTTANHTPGNYLPLAGGNMTGQINAQTINFDGVVSGTGAGGQIGRNHAYDTLELKGYGAELMIGAQNAGIHVNYRTCNGGVSGQTPTTWWWRAGSSTSWSDHYFGKVGAAVDVSAPIFYDSNNTGYYVDPSSVSNVNQVKTDALSVNTNGSQTTKAGLALYGAATSGEPTYGMMFTGISGSGAFGGVNGDWATYFTMNSTTGRGWVFRDVSTGNVASITNTGWAQFAQSVRAPIFYDSDNTGYFLNPSAANGNSLKTIGDWRQNTDGWSGEVGGKMQYHGSNWYIQATNSFIYRNAGGSNRFTVDNGGIGYIADYLTGANSLRAPIFYDSNDTSYLIDPQGTSSRIRKLLIFNGGAGGVGWSSGLNMGDTSNYWNMIQDAGTARQRNFGNGNYDWFNAAASQTMTLSTGSVLQVPGSMRAPIFYDSTNTAFYCDPASTSKFNDIWTTDGGNNGTAPRWDTSFYVAQSQHYYGHSSTQTMYLGESNTINIRSIGIASGSFRAPIFYDSANTGFYLDPASTGTSLNVAGDVVGYSSSDIRYKDNVKPIENALDKIDKIKGYTFEWNELSHKQTGKKDIGVIAQEVEEILPEIIDTRSDGYKAVDYPKLTALLIQSVKEQQIIINDLKSRIEKLEL